MAKFTINDVSLEFDVFELESAEKFQTGLMKIRNRSQELKSETDIVQSIKKQCTDIFDFIDTLFGEGTHKAIFGESINLRTCIRVFADIVGQISADKDTLLPIATPTKSIQRKRKR